MFSYFSMRIQNSSIMRAQALADYSARMHFQSASNGRNSGTVVYGEAARNSGTIVYMQPQQSRWLCSRLLLPAKVRDRPSLARVPGAWVHGRIHLAHI